MKADNKDYRVFFESGLTIGINTNSEEKAIILAQAKAIKNCWDYKVKHVEVA